MFVLRIPRRGVISKRIDNREQDIFDATQMGPFPARKTSSQGEAFHVRHVRGRLHILDDRSPYFPTSVSVSEVDRIRTIRCTCSHIITSNQITRRRAQHKDRIILPPRHRPTFSCMVMAPMHIPFSPFIPFLSLGLWWA